MEMHETINLLVRQVLTEHQDQVYMYHAGKASIGFLVAEVLRRSNLTDMKLVYTTLISELETTRKFL